MTLRVVFMGTPVFAVPTLMELVGQGHEVVAAYSQPPRPSGRGMAERPSPVHEAAERFGIPVRTPVSLRRDEAAAEFRALEADVAVVVAYGLILPPAILAAPRHGCLNLHGSLLPRWRGAAPIQRAIMAGDAETGVMVMRMEEGLDTGPVCMAERVRIGARETAGELAERLARLGADLMVRALAALERDALACTPQPAEGVTYAAKIDKAEARIDWARPAAEIARHINGLSPFPGAWCEMMVADKPERVKVLRAVPSETGGAAEERLVVPCGDGAVELLELQRAGRKPSKAEEFLRGARGGIRVLP
ncbi:methionyl-tRNA formyltransferase [Faunimonas sp. B44]|uniref:methionyl-tRNA formyltransferase n=1 Tax=Faunimonas sp. B44 TaxID=3461493 RepID=UPI00404463D5